MFGEFAVIVLGVFFAVAAESWWSDRENRRFERELREDILAEFETNLRILELDLASNDAWFPQWRGRSPTWYGRSPNEGRHKPCFAN